MRSWKSGPPSDGDRFTRNQNETMQELRWIPFMVWIAVLLSSFHWELDLPTKALVCMLSLASTFVVFADVSYSVAMTSPLNDTREHRDIAFNAGLATGPVAGILLYWFLVVRFLRRAHPCSSS